MEPSAFLAIMLVASSCGLLLDDAPTFADHHARGVVDDDDITETSGIAASRTHAHVLYTNNDAGGHPTVYAINGTNGQLVAKLKVTGASNTDWEDLAVGPCHTGTGHCIFIGEFGNHGGNGARNIIYRIREPAKLKPVMDVPIDGELHYTWSQPDAETLMVDQHGNLYIVSKVSINLGEKPKLAIIPASDWDKNTTIHLTNLTDVNIHSNRSDPRGGDLSHDGKQILIKTLDQVFYWYAPLADNYAHVLQTTPTAVRYHREPKGEALCWDSNDRGYYTIGEGPTQTLYYYKRTNKEI